MKRYSSLAAQHSIFIIYAVITLITAFFHEPWRDEAQAWLLARDLSPLAMIREMGYDGSPALWHFLLMPLAKAHLPYFSMQLLHWILALSAAGIFIYKSPFHPVFKTLFIFSYYPLYEYAIISRSYVLSILLLFTIALFFKDRLKKPWLFGFLVFLLMNTNTHNFMAGLALVLVFGISFYQERKKLPVFRTLIIPMLIMLAGIAAFVIQLIPPADSWKAGLANGFDWPWIFNAIGDAFMPSYLSNPGMTLFFKHWTELAFFTIFLLAAITYLFRERIPSIFFMVSITGLFMIITFKHSGYLRHYGFILIYLVFSLWIGDYPEFKKAFRMKKIKEGLYPGLGVFTSWFLALCLASSVIYGLYSLITDINMKFSGASEMAKKIEQHEQVNGEIIAWNVHTITAIVPYLPEVKFWDPGIQNYFSYIHWDKNYLPSRKFSPDTIVSRINLRLLKHPGSLILLPFSFDNAESNGLKLIETVDKNITGDEKYFLYQSLTYKR